MVDLGFWYFVERIRISALTIMCSLYTRWLIYELAPIRGFREPIHVDDILSSYSSENKKHSQYSMEVNPLN